MTTPRHVGPLEMLVSWATSTRAFRRNKVSLEKKVLAAALCNSGYSYRNVARMLGGMSYVAVRDAYFSLMTSLPEEEKKRREEVVIDGSDLISGGTPLHLWLARDAVSGEIMAFQASVNASVVDGGRFLAALARQCSNRPYLRLGEGPNEPRGLLNIDLYFQSAPMPVPSIIGRIGRLFLGGSVPAAR